MISSGERLPASTERIEDCRRERLQLFDVSQDVGVRHDGLAERPGLSAAREYVAASSSLVSTGLARDTPQALLIERDIANAGAPIL